MLFFFDHLRVCSVSFKQVCNLCGHFRCEYSVRESI